MVTSAGCASGMMIRSFGEDLTFSTGQSVHQRKHLSPSAPCEEIGSDGNVLNRQRLAKTSLSLEFIAFMTR
jgi:hypothetical protein